MTDKYFSPFHSYTGHVSRRKLRKLRKEWIAKHGRPPKWCNKKGNNAWDRGQHAKGTYYIDSHIRRYEARRERLGRDT